MTQRRVGKSIGYDDGQMVGKVLRGECQLLGTVATVNLGRVADKHGYSQLADLFSAPSSCTVPRMEGAETDLADLCIQDEMQAVVEGTGHATPAFAAMRYQKARAQARRVISGGHAMLRQIDRAEAARGDGAPAPTPTI
jgi:hypothetical protein